MRRWRLFPRRRRVEPDADTVLELRRTMRGDTALRVIEGLIGLDPPRRPEHVVGVAHALDRAAAAVLETACLSIDMAIPMDLEAPAKNVRDRLDAVRSVLDDILENLDPARATQEQVVVAASVRDTLERLSRLAELHASTTGKDLAIEPIPAAPGSLERRLVELEETTVDAIGELDAAVRLSKS